MRHILVLLLCLPLAVTGQSIERVVFDAKDSTGGYYLAMQPQSKIQGTLVVFTSFWRMEEIVAETRLHNVGYTNNLLVVFASTQQALYADQASVTRMNEILQHVAAKYDADTSKFVLASYQIAGNMALRFTELANEHPEKFAVQPKAFIGIDVAVDLAELARSEQRLIDKNFDADDIGTAKFVLDKFKGLDYASISPFDLQSKSPGNEQYLKNVAVRLYYDTDINWHLEHKRTGYYDTNMFGGSELISRLLKQGHTHAEFVAGRKGMRNNGMRRPSSMSIVEESDCIRWIKDQLGIFDAYTWIPPYQFEVPAGWGHERIPFPIEFAPSIDYKGVEDLLFMPGWADPASPEHWSYAFLWWLDGTQTFNLDKINTYLAAYYTGLVSRNKHDRNFSVMVTSMKRQDGTFQVGITMPDYHTGKQIRLNCIIHVKELKNNTAVLFEVSPQPFKHRVWTELDKLVNGFKGS